MGRRLENIFSGISTFSTYLDIFISFSMMFVWATTYPDSTYLEKLTFLKKEVRYEILFSFSSFAHQTSLISSIILKVKSYLYNPSSFNSLKISLFSIMLSFNDSYRGNFFIWFHNPFESFYISQILSRESRCLTNNCFVMFFSCFWKK